MKMLISNHFEKLSHVIMSLCGVFKKYMFFEEREYYVLFIVFQTPPFQV